MKKKGFKMFFMVIVIISLFGAIVMLLWNFLMPGIFGLNTINFWQALGLFLLARIFVGGFGAAKMMMMGGMMNHAKNPLREKWENMSPEERKEFIRRRRESGFRDPRGMSDFCDKEDFKKNDNRDFRMHNDEP